MVLPEAMMKTQAELSGKLAWLIAQQANFTDACQLAQLATDIRRLKWVLGIGPDVVQVPKVGPA